MKKPDYAAMYTLRSDGRYQGYYRDDKGRHVVYDRDPEKLYHKILAKTSRPEVKPKTVQEISDQWERAHREEIETKTWNNYAPHIAEIRARHGKKPVRELSAADVSAHLLWAKSRGYSATVINTIRSLYRMILDCAVMEQEISFNPCYSVRMPKGLKRGKRTAPNDDQIKAIFRNIDKPFGLFPVFLLCTGLRKSEALALSWADIDFDAGTISVTKSLDYTSGAHPKIKPPKTEAGFRTVPIVPELVPYLQEARQRSGSDYLFPAESSTRGGKGGGIMTLRGYDGAWQRYCEAAGFIDADGKPTITAHNLRHGTATLMFEAGVDELSTQKILGHSRIEITREIYTDLRAAQAQKSVAKFNAGMQGYFQGKK